MKKVLSFILVFLISGNAYAAMFSENTVYMANTNKTRLTIDHTKIGSALSLPVAITLTSSNFQFENCDAAGLSLLCTTEENAGYLNFEREIFNPVNEIAACHAFIDADSSSDTTFYLQYKTETARGEQFVDYVHTDSESGLTRSINRPTKTGSPIFGDSGWTWDRDMGQFFILTDPSWPEASRYRFFYDGHNTTGDNVGCYGYGSTIDPGSMTKPNLGQVTYDGDTNNNIISYSGADELQYIARGLVYVPIEGIYVTMVKKTGGVNDQAMMIMTSTSPTGPFTLQKALPNWADNTTHPNTGLGLTRREDGRWIAYYQHWNNTTAIRSIGAYLSDTVELDGTWTDLGVLVHGTSTTNQRHDAVGRSKFWGIEYSPVTKYLDSGDPKWGGPIVLTVSRNAIDIIEIDETWLDRGSSGEWDDYSVYGNQMFRNGDNWDFYYRGWAEGNSRPFSSYIGKATIGYMRIGQIARTSAGEGTFISKAITVSDTDLWLNAVADGANDKIEVELLDASDDSVITNYAQTDFTDFTGDDYDHVAMWGSNHIYNCPTKLVKIKFYLTKSTNDVKLHAYTIGYEEDCLWDMSTPRTVFPDDYRVNFHCTDNRNDGKARTGTIRSSAALPSDSDTINYLNLRGTKVGSGNPAESIVDVVGYSQDFNGTTSYVTTPPNMEFLTNFHSQIMFNFGAVPSGNMTIFQKGKSPTTASTDLEIGVQLQVHDGYFRFISAVPGAFPACYRTWTLDAFQMVKDTDYVIDFTVTFPTVSGLSLKILADGGSINTYDESDGTWGAGGSGNHQPLTNAYVGLIGTQSNNSVYTNFVDGRIGEMRLIDTTTRSTSDLRDADMYSIIDNLLTYTTMGQRVPRFGFIIFQ